MKRLSTYVILACLFIWIPASSQVLRNYGEQLIHIQKDAIVTVIGDLQNDGTIINNGTFSVASHWDNNGVYNGQGEVILNGAQSQDLDNNGQDIYKLTMNGAGEKVLKTNLNITSELSLLNGILTPGENAVLSLAQSAAVSNASATAYVNGPLRHTGTGYKFFPVGQNGNYRPLELIDVTGINPVISVEVREGSFQPNSIDENLSGLSEIRYWQVNPQGGTYHGSLVKLSIGSDEGFDNLIGAVVAEAPEANGNFVSLGQSKTTGDATEGTVTSETVSVEKILALGLTSRYSVQKTILIPSAFAPNGAKPEDQRLVIFGNDVVAQGFSFKIFNRWGHVVYETDSYDAAVREGWNGEDINTRQMSQFGVYSYILRARFEDGETVKKTGTVTLFR